MADLSIRDLVGADGGLIAGWISLPEPLVGEACIRAGFPAVVVDMQHGLVDLASAFRLIAAIRHAGGRSLLRIPVGEHQTASRLLDAGADMIITPMIESAADAAAFAAFVKYPPLGQRSWGPTRAMQLAGLGGDYVGAPDAYRPAANAGTLAIAMIETRPALAALDDILALDAIDGVFVGPADLSIALSDGASLNVEAPEAVAAFRHVAARARAAGKIAGIYGVDPAHAARCLAMGFHFVTLMSDLGYLAAGAKAALAAARTV